MKSFKLSKRIIAILTVIAMLSGYFVLNVVAVEETTIPVTGYAAVGVVDEQTQKAEVLLGTGEQGTVYFNGSAPETGAVYSYTRDANNLYTFTKVLGNHGYSDQMSSIGWNFFYTPNGWMWAGNGQTFFQSSSPIFIRYGNDNWALSALSSFADTSGGTWVYGYMLDAYQTDSVNNYWAVGAIVLGGYNNGTIDTTGFDTSFPNITATNSLAAFTTDLHENVNLDAIVLESGYAAIGHVDTASHKVEILKADGTQGSVYYTGKAPLSNGFYTYTRDTNNLYTFTDPVDAYESNPNAHYGTAMWFSPNGWFWTATPTHYYPGSSPIFVRYGEDKWSIKTITEVVTDGSACAYTFVFDVNESTPAITLVGGMPNGTLDTTGIATVFGSDAEYDLATFSIDLHADVNLDAIVLESGYAAVGYVDTAASTANVLLANGETATVTYTGTAPASGTVYAYTKTGNGTYTFALPIANSGMGDTIADTGYMTAYPDNAYGGYIWGPYLTDSHHFWYDGVDIPVFVRVSATQWAIADESQFVATYPNCVYAYMLDVVPRANSPETYHNVGAVLINGYNPDGSANAVVYGDGFPMGQIVDLGETPDSSGIDGKISASVGGVNYDSLQKAVELALNNYVYLSLLEDAPDATIVVPEGSFLLLDLNGHTLGKVIANGSLYGIDNSTRDYTNENFGKILEFEGNIAPFQRTDDRTKEHVCNGFAAYKDETGCSFHYFEVKIASVVLRASESGIGYKLHLAGNAQVKALLNQTDAYGVNVYIEGHKENGKSRFSAADTFQVGTQTKMVMIKNILCGSSAEENAKYGKMNICVEGYIQIGDTKIVVAFTAGRNLRQMVETANEKLNSYEKEQIDALKAMYRAYDLGNAAFSEWAIGNIAALVNNNEE